VCAFRDDFLEIENNSKFGFFEIPLGELYREKPKKKEEAVKSKEEAKIAQAPLPPSSPADKKEAPAD
jgi:hypothetical protein